MERKESGRHLAAILFTDIVGYTAMMQRNETAALDTVRRHQQVLEHEVPKHEGEIYQYYGDGSMSIFHSAIQAVKCALEIQKALLSEPIVLLRIGIHIGEIYSEGGKVFGDGVNIASRIESIGQGGTVLFSRDVYEKIRNHGLFQIKPVGKFEFKNVDDPVEVFSLSNPEIATLDLKNIEGKLKEQARKKQSRLPYILGSSVLLLGMLYFFFLRPAMKGHGNADAMEKQSIAVLPFENLSEGKDEDFLGIGIAEDILTQLAQIHGLKVISRTSSMQYKDSNKPIRTIAKELKVNNILEGSIRKVNNDLRVSVQLTNGQNESLVWAADFDRKFEDVLNVQRDVALQVSNKLKVSLSPEVRDRLQDKVNVNPEAYIFYQKGREQLLSTSGTTEDIESAMDYFEQSISLDSNFALAWVGIAEANNEGVFWHRIDVETGIDKARKAAMHALKIDPKMGEAYGALGGADYADRKFLEAEKNSQLAIQYSPNYSFAYERLGWIALMRNDVDEAVRIFKQAVDLDPLSTRLQGTIGNALAVVGEYDLGIKLTEEYLSASPHDNYLLWTLGFLYARKGDYAKAISYLTRRSIGLKTNWILGYCYAKSGQREKAEEILNNNLEKKKTEVVPDFMIGVQYMGLGDQEKAMEHLLTGLGNKGESFFIIDLEHDPFFTPLKNNPEFRNAVDRVNRDFKLPKKQNG